MSINAKKLMAGIALAASAIAAHAAPGALTFEKGDSVTINNAVFNTGVASFGNSITAPAGSSFTDLYTFSLPSLSTLGAYVNSARFKTAVSLKDLVISDFYLQGAKGSKYEGEQMLGGMVDYWTIDANNLVQDDYSLVVVGSVARLANGGKYDGEVSVMSPVPEPATWGMMVGGLGLVGFLARRRKAADNNIRSEGAMAAA